MTLEKKIREMFHEYYRGSGCDPLFVECEEEVLEELGKVAQKIRERIMAYENSYKIHRNAHSFARMWEYNGRIIEASQILGLLVEPSEQKPRTICLSCGYDGDDIQGDNADLYEGYGCPKCHSPLVVIVENSKVEGEK